MYNTYTHMYTHMHALASKSCSPPHFMAYECMQLQRWHRMVTFTQPLTSYAQYLLPHSPPLSLLPTSCWPMNLRNYKADWHIMHTGHWVCSDIKKYFLPLDCVWAWPQLGWPRHYHGCRGALTGGDVYGRYKNSPSPSQHQYPASHHTMLLAPSYS